MYEKDVADLNFHINPSSLNEFTNDSIKYYLYNKMVEVLFKYQYVCFYWTKKIYNNALGV